MRRFELLVSIPFLLKGRVFLFDDETGEVFTILKDGEVGVVPLRAGLALYLWLLVTEKKYMQEIK